MRKKIVKKAGGVAPLTLCTQLLNSFKFSTVSGAVPVHSNTIGTWFKVIGGKCFFQN